MMTLKYASLHNPLFLGGTNLQDKLDISKRTGIQLVYDRKEKELLIKWNNEVAIIPYSNVASMIPLDPNAVTFPIVAPQAPAQPKHKPTGKPIQAQVSDPTRDTVFSQGPGKVRD